MDRFLRYAIPLMFAGIVAALLYWVFSASSKPSNSNPIARFAQGELQDLDTSDAGQPAPEAVFLNSEGKEVRLADFKGDTLVVNFWATWCGPCEREMPSLAALQSARKDRNLRIIAISVDSPADHDYARKRLGELSGNVLDFYVLKPGAEGWNIVYDAGAEGGFPTTILFDADGNRIAKLEGEADWASYDAIALIDALLAG